MSWFGGSRRPTAPRPESPKGDGPRPHLAVSASRLAHQLLDTLDDHLVPTRRLADEQTWIGPAARALQDDLRVLERRLQQLADDWLALGRQASEP